MVDHDHIEDSFINFYSNLWHEPVDCDYLTRDITKDEIFSTLNSLADGKSSGPDGFNAEFYKFFWDDLGDDLFATINHFMLTASML